MGENLVHADRVEVVDRRAETDRLVTLYQRTATHLSQVRSAAPDPTLVGRLSTLVARARGRLTGSGESAWRDVARFATVSCPAALYRVRWWATAVTAASLTIVSHESVRSDLSLELLYDSMVV